MEQIWRVPDGQVASGRIAGYVGAVRLRGELSVRTGGAMALGGPPMREDTLFRIASLTKPIGGALLLSLVQDGVLALADPVARWLPELAAPRVLQRADGPLEDTVPAARDITVRHLATMTCGWGAVFANSPLKAAMVERKVYPGPLPPPLTADQFVARAAELPLAFQPGEGWLYDTGMNLLGVLVSRATGVALPELVAARITRPLRMRSTMFWTADVARLATAYEPARGGGLQVLDLPAGHWSHPPSFAKLSGGLLSTAGDLLRFFEGLHEVLEPDSVALMTSDALTEDQRAQAAPVVGPGRSWGIGTGVSVESPGRWGWQGGTGTTAFADPARDTVAVLLTQRRMTSAQDGFDDFEAAVAAAA